MCAADAMNAGQLTDFARHAEASGLSMIWVPELYGRDPFITAASLLSATNEISVGTAIANVYVRDARATKSAAYSLQDAYPGRFELGLGLSNKVGNEPRGHEWLSPIAKMQDFMDRYDDARLMFPCSDNVPCYLAAHGPKLMDFAAQRLDGAFSYLQTSRFSVEAKKKLGSGRLNLMQPTVFLEDEKSARAAARKAISIYLPLENYHRAWRERGFVDSDFAGEGTDEFIDELVVWGDDRRIATKYEEQFSCGADHLIIIPVKLDLKNELGWQRLSNIVKGAGQINA